jgi:O-acetylserine/cysteine efflux transporter
MSIAHLLLALAVVIVWGTNFVIIKFGLGEFPPLLLASLRFFFSCVPWLLFIRRPQVPWRLLVGNGVFLGFGLFGILFIAMRADISPGIASLLVQTQAFFTIGLSMLLLGERVRTFQLAGLALSVAGLAMFFLHVDATTTLLGLLLTLLCGFSWAIANMVVKAASTHVQRDQSAVTPGAPQVPGKNLDMLAFMVWSSLFAVPPLFAASLAFEGSTRIMAALAQADAVGWVSAL